MFLSILIPVYNVEAYLQRCLDSLLCQNLPDDVEIICVDDGSTDRSGAICDEYEKKYLCIRVIHQENKGLAGARNTSVKASRGKYLAFVDSDDYVSENWYPKIRTTLESENCDVLLFDLCLIENGIVRKERIYKPCSGQQAKNDIIYDLTTDVVLHSYLVQMVYKRNLFDGITFPEDRVSLEDYAVLYKVLVRADTFYYLRESLYFYCLRGDSITSKLSCEARMKTYQLEAERREFLQLHGYRVSRLGHWFMALTLCRDLDKIESREKAQMCSALGKKIIRKDLPAIIKAPDCPLNLKLKFILVSVGLYDFVRSMRNKVYSLKSRLF